jgi:predicted glycoside hydrolase/deacetylase ChbG (UPF0249 family)
MLQLFVPLLAREQGMRGESRFWVTEEQHMMEHIGHELLTNMQRFTAQVLPIHIPHTHTHTHTQRTVVLRTLIPTLNPLSPTLTF